MRKIYKCYKILVLLLLLIIFWGFIVFVPAHKEAEIIGTKEILSKLTLSKGNVEIVNRDGRLTGFRVKNQREYSFFYDGLLNLKQVINYKDKEYTVKWREEFHPNTGYKAGYTFILSPDRTEEYILYGAPRWIVYFKRLKT